MVEDPSSMRYQTVEIMMENGSLGSKKLLVMQKVTGGTGLIFIQAESVRFSGDGSRISFDDTTGEISGGAFSDVLRGTDHSVDILKGEGGNDVLVSYGALIMRWIS